MPICYRTSGDDEDRPETDASPVPCRDSNAAEGGFSTPIRPRAAQDPTAGGGNFSTPPPRAYVIDTSSINRSPTAGATNHATAPAVTGGRIDDSNLADRAGNSNSDGGHVKKMPKKKMPKKDKTIESDFIRPACGQGPNERGSGGGGGFYDERAGDGEEGEGKRRKGRRERSSTPRGVKGGTGSKWSLKALQRRLVDMGVDVPALWRDINDVVIKTLIAIEAQVKCAFGLHLRLTYINLMGHQKWAEYLEG